VDLWVYPGSKLRPPSPMSWVEGLFERDSNSNSSTPKSRTESKQFDNNLSIF
jgi:hypothetical protein